jgi:hypothetical protein
MIAAGLGISAMPELVLPLLSFTHFTTRPLERPAITRKLALRKVTPAYAVITSAVRFGTYSPHAELERSQVASPKHLTRHPPADAGRYAEALSSAHTNCRSCRAWLTNTREWRASPARLAASRHR